MITLFSLIFFDQGVKIWFNENLEKVVYESKQISNNKQSVLKSYDILLNKKYNVVLNQKTIERVKNFFQ